MPIMVPLADVLGLTRQTAVMCFQFGDGFTNSIIPTSSTLMANLGTANITYDKYVRFITPLMLLWFALGIVFVVIATMVNYGPF
ncbi:MAG: C4-dicarboxylate ABC transporter permease, partial [Firmicutes bacterium]|nr:C4-dicarboxylate ABC transporter permease [Bacillota bacterium]